jgi:hypothetical protein
VLVGGEVVHPKKERRTIDERNAQNPEGNIVHGEDKGWCTFKMWLCILMKKTMYVAAILHNSVNQHFPFLFLYGPAKHLF